MRDVISSIPQASIIWTVLGIPGFVTSRTEGIAVMIEILFNSRWIDRGIVSDA